MVSCILLAAGLSSRFGSPKGLAMLNGKTILERHQHNLLLTKVTNIIVVLGAEAEKHRPHILRSPKITSVHNPDYLSGQTSSVKCGVSALHPSHAAMILPVDFPFVQGATVDDLIREYERNRPLILVPSLHGRKGHPPIFSPDLRNDILSLSESVGLNDILHRNLARVSVLPVEDEGVLATFNTPEELAKIKTEFI